MSQRDASNSVLFVNMSVQDINALFCMNDAEGYFLPMHTVGDFTLEVSPKTISFYSAITNVTGKKKQQVSCLLQMSYHPKSQY